MSKLLDETCRTCDKPLYQPVDHGIKLKNPVTGQMEPLRILYVYCKEHVRGILAGTYSPSPSS